MTSRSWSEGLTQDFGYAARQLRLSPGYAAVVVATLALAIGGTTAVFSVVKDVLLAPLPYDQPGQLVRLYQQEPGNVSTRYFLTGVHFKSIRDEASLFEDVAALNTYSETGLDLLQDGQAQRLRVLEVTSGYFRTLRSSALRGPGFTAEDDAGTKRVVLSDRLWRTRFNSDASIVGATVRLSAEPYEVAAVAPAGFVDPIAGEVDAWVAYDLAGNTGEENYSISAVGRLRHGVTVEQAATELAALSQSMKERWPGTRRSVIAAVPLKADIVAPSSGPLTLITIAVGLLLLVACVNVANLVLVRATGRVHEFAIRTALGSGRARLVRQLAVESMLAAGLGGLLGLVLAWYGIEILRAIGRDAIPRVDRIGFDLPLLAFAALVTLGACLVSGVAPAWRLAHVPPSDAMRQQSRSATGTRAQGRVRSGLAAAQLALALTLLTGAGVLLASFYRLQQVDLGFRADRVLTFEVSLPSVQYDAARRAAFHEELATRLERIPGVVDAGGTSRLPATGSLHPWGTRIETGPLAGKAVSRGSGVMIQQRTISGDFFAALGIPVLAGRTFDARDDASVPGRAVVSADFARLAFPGMPFDAVIGQRISPLNQRREIIGVAGDVALDAYGATTVTVYHSHRQFASNRNWALSQVVSTDVPPDQVLAAVRAEVAAMDPGLVVYRVAPMTEVVGRSASRQRFALVLMGAFAATSLMLAALGLYGVLAYAVRQRSQEIGIRLALGATAGQVRGLVLRQAAKVVAVGLVAGISGALMLGRWMTSLVFETSPWDPRILSATAIILAITAFASSWLPAWRASRVEPRSGMLGG